MLHDISCCDQKEIKVLLDLHVILMVGNRKVDKYIKNKLIN